MSIVAGRSVTLSVSSDDATYYTLNGLSQADLDLILEQIESTALGDDAHARVGGLFDSAISVSGWCSAEANGAAVLLAAVQSGDPLWVQINYGSGGAVNVKTVVESFDLRLAIDGLVAFAASLKGIAVSDTTAHSLTTLTALGPYSARLSSVYLTGTAASMTAEAMSLVSGATYQISNTAKRILDPSQAVAVFDGGVAISSTTYTIDYLFGKVVFDTAPTGAVTITGYYLPRAEAAEVYGATVNIKADLADSTAFGAESRAKEKTTKDANGSFDLRQSGQEAIVSGDTVRSIIEARRVVVLDIALGDSGKRFRAFGLLGSAKQSSAPGDLIKTVVAFAASEQSALHAGSDAPSFGVG